MPRRRCSSATPSRRPNSFLVGALVFGVPAAICILVTALLRPEELRNAWRRPADLLGLNVTSAGAWLAYLIAIQLIEPAVAFAVFSGAIPLAAQSARRLGRARGPAGSPATRLGRLMLVAGMAVLAVSTLAGWSGFVRGGAGVAVAGLALAALAGSLIAGMLAFSARLGDAGVGPLAQFGLRFPLYTVLALGGFALGLDAKGALPASELALVAAAGLVLLAFPIYAVQKAVSLTSATTVGVFAATGPLMVFVMQLADSRIAYAPATLVGLSIYFAGALTGLAASRAAPARPDASEPTSTPSLTS